MMHIFRPIPALILGFLLILLGSTGCKIEDRYNFEEIGSLTINPDVAVPLVYSEVSASELFDALEADDEFVEIGNDGLVILTYSDSLYSLGVEEYLSIPDQVVPVLSSTASIPIEFFGGGSISQANVKTGFLNVEVTVATTGQYELQLNFEDATLQGQPLVLTENFSQTSYTSIPVDISGGIFAFSDGSFDFSYTLTDLNTNLPVVPISLVVNATDFSFSYVQGRFVEFLVETGSDSLETRILDKFSGEAFEVDDPEIRFIFNNSTGGPVEIAIDPIEAVNTRDGSNARLENADVNGGFLLAYPLLTEVGEFRQTVVALDDQNTNIDVLTNLFPDRVNYDWRVSIGMDSNPEDYFLLDTSRVDISVEVEVPLRIRAKALTYRDTVSLGAGFEWPELTEPTAGTQLQEAEVKLITENGLPLSISGQIYVLDSDGFLLDSLLTRGEVLLAPAPVDGTGEVTGINVQEVLIPIDAERYDRIQQGTQLGYRLRVETSDQGNSTVRFNEANSLGIKIGVRALLSSELSSE